MVVIDDGGPYNNCIGRYCICTITCLFTPFFILCSINFTPYNNIIIHVATCG